MPFFTVPVRLAGLDNINYAGRVEVFYQGKWGKICRNQWDINDVKVVCKQLGFQSAVAEFIGMDTKDQNIPVVMSNVACTGQESVLASCKRFDGKDYCVDNKGAQAFCEPSKLTINNELLFRMCDLWYYIIECILQQIMHAVLTFDVKGARINTEGKCAII